MLPDVEGIGLIKAPLVPKDDPMTELVPNALA